LGEEEPRSWSGCDDTCSLKFRAETGEMLGGMVMANVTEILRAVDLTVPISSAIAASHRGVVYSISVVKGLLRRSVRVSGGRCM
jgi:hypothetical protein